MSMTLEEAIEHAENIAVSAIGCECREEHRQLAAWLRELQERRKAPEIIFCKDCKAFYCDFCLKTLKPVEKEKDYCSLAERRIDGQ